MAASNRPSPRPGIHPSASRATEKAGDRARQETDKVECPLSALPQAIEGLSQELADPLVDAQIADLLTAFRRHFAQRAGQNARGFGRVPFVDVISKLGFTIR